ncbi:MAG TPA: glycosyltransferase [Pseudolysinimonas sp.]|nr:glycosyltransferase [Pseudolysinimonas sp.]
MTPTVDHGSPWQPSGAEGRSVLHVVENWGSGVRAATLQFVRATPEVEHHLLRGTFRTEFVDDNETGFASIRLLPSGFFARRRAVRRAVHEVHPDVVHAHSFYAGVLVRLTIRNRCTCRIAYSPHCFGFERRDVWLPKRLGIRLVERVLARNTDTLAASSPREARTAARLHVHRVVSVPYATQIPALAMFERRNPLRVAAVGRIGAQRDPDFFRKTIDLLRVTQPDVMTCWIGDGDDTRARHRLEKAGIHTTGWLPSFDAHRTLGAAGLYLHTARWDGFPLSILEAVELGVPVIAREVRTLRGMVATPGLTTPAAMAAAASALIAGGDVTRQRNLDMWRQLFAFNTIEHQAEALRAIYTTGATAAVLRSRLLRYWEVARHARHLVTVSEFSRGERAEVLGVDPNRFAVAPNGHQSALAAGVDAEAIVAEGDTPAPPSESG